MRRPRGDRGRGAEGRRRDLRAALRPASCRSAGSGCGSARSPRPPTPSRCNLTGPGGHTARPHLTADLVHALGRVIIDVPALLDRRVDPRAGGLPWSGARCRPAGVQRHPGRGRASGHRAHPQPRRLARGARDVAKLIRDVVAPTGAEVESEYIRGVPPVINDRMAIGGDRRRGRRRAGRRPGGRGRDQHGRRGLRLLPGARARRDGPARHGPPGSDASRPAPGELRRRRAGHRLRRARHGAHRVAGTGGGPVGAGGRPPPTGPTGGGPYAVGAADAAAPPAPRRAPR